MRRTSLNRRLWMGGGAIGLFLLTLLVGNQFTPVDKSVTREMLGHDFLAFYTAGSFVDQHRSHELYNLESVRLFEQQTGHSVGLEIGKSFGPWWNPPFYALPFAPLSRLPYPRALVVWRWINLAALAGAVALLCGVLIRAGHTQFRVWGLVPLLVLAAMPFVQGLSHGQNTFTSLLLLAATVVAWRGERGVWAGIVCGLLFYKPQLGAVLAAALVADLGLPALVGVGITGLALLSVNCWLLPGTLAQYLHQLPLNVHWMQVEHMYLWERHVTLKAFWRLLLQGRGPGEMNRLGQLLTALSVGAVAILLLRAWASRVNAGVTNTEPLWRDRWITAAVLATPLLMPFYFDYDLLLLAVPAVLFACERADLTAEPSTMPRRTIVGWCVLYLWLFVNPPVAFHTHVNGTVLLVSLLATAHAVRAARRQQLPMVETATEARRVARVA